MTKSQNAPTFTGNGSHSCVCSLSLIKIKTCTSQLGKRQSADTNVLIDRYQLSAVANFLPLKMSRTCTYCSTTSDIHHPTLAVMSVTFFFEADVKCCLYEINKKKQSKCYTWTEFNPESVPRPNRSDVGTEKSRTRTRTCTNTSS